MSSKNDDIKKAVALKYTKKDSAPKVVAKGKGYLAFVIEDIAKQHNVYIKQDKSLTGELYKLNLDTEIPPQLYEAVAKILSFVYKLKKL